jgi:transcriptional regulator with XRE-family HTH domain
MSVDRNFHLFDETMIDDIPQRIGARIREARLDRHLSLKELGKHAGVTHQQMWKYEVGKNPASVKVLTQLAGLFDIPLSFFIEDADRPTAAPLFRISSGRTALLCAYDELDSRDRSVLISIAKSMAEARRARVA